MLAMPGMRAFSLAAKRGSEGVSCDASGVFVGGVPLLRPPSAERRYWTIRLAAEINKELTVRYGLPIDIGSKAGAVSLIAAALNRGDLAMASIAAVQMQFPDPPPLGKTRESQDEVVRRARELDRSDLLKFFWNPAQHPRAGVPPNPGWFTLVGDKPEHLEVIPGNSNINPADKPWEPPPAEGEEGEYGPRGIVELPLPGAGPRAPSAGSPGPVETKTGPKPLSAYGSTSASSSEESLPPKIGSFPVPDDLTYGTTSFGNYAHDKTAELLDEMYRDVEFIFRVGPGQRGIDVEVPEDFISVVGHQYLEIKPLTPSGQRSLNQQTERWGVGPVQALTYDSAGNLYYGFRK
jgi:hypothetical protein